MTNTTKKVLDILKSYNIDTDRVVSEITEIDDNVDRIKIGNTSISHVYPSDVRSCLLYSDTARQ